MRDTISTEQAVIGGLMLLQDPDSEVVQKVFAKVKNSSFQSQQNAVVFNAIKTLAAKGMAFDMLMVESQLKKTNEIDSAGGFQYLAEVSGNTPSAANILAYVEVVRENSILRVANQKLQAALALINEPNGGSAYEKLGMIETEIEEMLNRGLKNKESGLVHIKEISEQWTNELELRFTDPDKVMGYKTGIESLDSVLYPKYIPKGSFVVVGARPKMGKTAFLNNLCTTFAIEHKKAVASFSLEMPSVQILERLVVERARVKPDILYKGASNDSDFAKVMQAVGEYADSQFYIDDTPGISLSHVRRESRKLAKKTELGLIAVDYLTLMEGEKAERNDLSYGAITKGLKNLAKELNCVVVLLTQLNRKLEDRKDKRPMPSDSRDTGQIEQDCDLWVGLYREGVYEDLAPVDEGKTEAIIRLNRHGGTGTGYLDLVDGYFVECEPFSFEKQTPKRDF